MTHQITLSSNAVKHLMQMTSALLKDHQEVHERLRKEYPQLDVSEAFVVDFYDSVKEFQCEVIKNVPWAHWCDKDWYEEDDVI